MRWGWVLVVAGCGRVAFDPRSDGGDGDGNVSALDDTRADGTAPLGPFGAFGTPVEQFGINTPVREFGTTISDDGLEIYWTSFATPTAGGTSIWRSTRNDRQSMFTSATQMGELDTTLDDDEPSLSHDGRTLIYQHFTTRQLVVSTRQSPTSAIWSASVPLETVANLAGFEGADFGPDDLRLVVMNTTSREMYEVTRPTTSSPWGVPVLLPGLGGMTGDGYPAIRSDGLEIFWESTRQPPHAIYHALRPAIDQPFGAPERISFGPTIDGSGAGDPDITADGRTLVFVAIPSTDEYDVYLAERSPL